MAHFTEEFGKVLEYENGKVVFAYEEDNDNTKVVGGMFEKVFERFPIFDEDYRERLVGLIIDRYYNQEIGHETPGKFRLQFRAKLNEIMPTYNKIYVAMQKEIDPYKTIDIKTVSSGEATQTISNTGTSSTETATKSDSRSVFSDLPQTMLAGNEDYAANATDANSGTGVTGQASETGNSQSENENLGESQTTGFQGSQTEMLALFIESLRNIDTLLLDELQPLFMSLFMNGDAYTQIESPHYNVTF